MFNDCPDSVAKAIGSLNYVSTVDWGMYNIIFDEMESYYLQGKSEETVAKEI